MYVCVHLSCLQYHYVNGRYHLVHNGVRWCFRLECWDCSGAYDCSDSSQANVFQITGMSVTIGCACGAGAYGVGYGGATPSCALCSSDWHTTESDSEQGSASCVCAAGYEPSGATCSPCAAGMAVADTPQRLVYQR